MGNIIWKNADNSISVSATPSVANREIAIELMSQGAVPYDSVPLAFNVDTSQLPKEPISCWEYLNNALCVNVGRYKELTKQRLRAERKPLLEDLDIMFRRALGTGSDLVQIETEANRLRNITDLVDLCDSVQECAALTCYSTAR